MSATRPATGRQHEIRHGAALARVGEVAAVLREFSVGGVPFTETWDDDEVPPMGCGIVLVPWPNRVADGRWTYQGVEQKLDITDLSNGNAIHGLLRNTAYQPVSVQDSAVTLAASIYPQHGYPFTLDTEVRYAVSDDGLSVTHRLTNVGTAAAPFGVGAHPYLRVGAASGRRAGDHRVRHRVRADERAVDSGVRWNPSTAPRWISVPGSGWPDWTPMSRSPGSP